MLKFIKSQLTPNRLAVYFTALAALGTALVTVLGDLDFQSTAGVIGSLVVLGGVVAKWLAGWQQYEQASYRLQVIENERVAAIEVQQAQAEARAEAVKAAAAPRGRGLAVPPSR